MAESTEQRTLDLGDSELEVPKSELEKSQAEKLKLSDITLRHKQLCDLIARYDHEYYALDAPSVPDSEYDQIYQELQSLESLHPSLITAESPTQRISGSATNAFNSITHRQAMLSLNNALINVFAKHLGKIILNMQLNLNSMV
jgi:hypothetical protein